MLELHSIHRCMRVPAAECLAIETECAMRWLTVVYVRHLRRTDSITLCQCLTIETIYYAVVFIFNKNQTVNTEKRSAVFFEFECPFIWFRL